MTHKASEAKHPTDISPDPMTDRIRVSTADRDAVIIVRKGGEVEVHMALGQVVEPGQLLALGVAWSCQNEEWRLRVMEKARARLEEELEGIRDMEVTLFES